MTPTFHYDVSIELRFSDDELRVLTLLSERHYDFRCKSVGQRGGFLYGMRNWQEASPDAQHVLSFKEIDTLCKVLEQSDLYEETRAVASPLRVRLRDALDSINREHARLSPARGA